MTIVAGIDEAGYGPLLGPLVVAASAFRIADGGKERDLHALVDDSAALADGLPVADSKRLYHGRRSLAAIETSTLGHVVLARGLLPVTLGGLLEQVAIDLTADEHRALPWYAGRLTEMTLPRDADCAEVVQRAERHGARLAKRGLAVAGLFVAPVPVPRFNRTSAAAGSKAFTLFHATGRLIETLAATYADDELLIHIDRQGGRIHYGDLLQTFFPFAPLVTLGEQRSESRYRLQWPGRPSVEIRFRVKADDSRAPVAVASIAAKTVRELFMHCLNEWFIERLPGLAPTAGYAVDGKRFLDEVTGLLKREGIDHDLFVRCR